MALVSQFSTGGERKFLPISSVSMLGTCETRYADAIFGRLYKTPAMKNGERKHDEVARVLPKINKDEIMTGMKAAKKSGIRELPIWDGVLKLSGKIDQLDLTGNVVDGRSEAIVIDDKYTGYPHDSIEPQYKLQLAAYASAMRNSDYGQLCEIVGARLRYRNRSSGEVTQEFGVERGELLSWKANVPLAAKVAWVLYKKEREPEHRRFDVGSGEWSRCYCGIKESWAAQERKTSVL